MNTELQFTELTFGAITAVEIALNVFDSRSEDIYDEVRIAAYSDRIVMHINNSVVLLDVPETYSMEKKVAIGIQVYLRRVLHTLDREIGDLQVRDHAVRKLLSEVESKE